MAKELNLVLGLIKLEQEMELVVNKIYETLFHKNSLLSFKEKLKAIILGVAPLFIFIVYFLIKILE